MPAGNVTTIYVALINEGLDVWRPVQAVHEQGDVFRIVSQNPDPIDEHWQFSTGENVVCKEHTFSDGQRGLVACERVYTA
jgi:hypothetical protein